jgi:hypothetical protein
MDVPPLAFKSARAYDECDIDGQSPHGGPFKTVQLDRVLIVSTE